MVRTINAGEFLLIIDLCFNRRHFHTKRDRLPWRAVESFLRHLDGGEGARVSCPQGGQNSGKRQSMVEQVYYSYMYFTSINMGCCFGKPSPKPKSSSYSSLRQRYHR